MATSTLDPGSIARTVELRAIAHIVDMHQLTKDPEWVLMRGQETGVVARRAMSAFELGRYLDYCSEMLALTGKVAAVYIQRFEDPVALQAVNEVEEPHHRTVAEDLAEADGALRPSKTVACRAPAPEIADAEV